MKTGSSEKLITPLMPVELSGYIGRIQPSTGKYDELYARVLFMESKGTKIAWINCDLLAFSNRHAERIRQLAAVTLDINIDNVILSAIHTHSGPATVKLRKCGDVDPDYIIYLETQIIEAVREAAASLSTVDIYFSETSLDSISRDRRMQANRHVDNKLPITAFVKADNTYDAILINFTMHNVGLSAVNRNISADIAGYAANWVKSHLPGQPDVLITNGGCGNIDPVDRADDYSAVEKLGKILGEKIIEGLADSAPIHDESLEISFDKIELPFAELSSGEVAAMLENHHKYFLTQADSYMNSCVYAAMREWARDTIGLINEGKKPESGELFFQIIKIGPLSYVGINAEVFSPMADTLRKETGQGQLYIVGYANGCIGYLPPKEIYKEGGYEIESAYKFYASFMIRSGGFEKLQEAILEKLKQ